MANGVRPLQMLDDGFLGEMLADQAETALRVELLPVEGDDASRLLAVLKPSRMNSVLAALGVFHAIAHRITFGCQPLQRSRHSSP
jgi:hypothetical protein